jgi:putative oxidoreductase
MNRTIPATAERTAGSALNPNPAGQAVFWGRLALGSVMLAHGLQKLGLFGGAGVTATIDTFQSQLGIAPALTALVIATEVVGGAALILGLFARLAAAFVGIEMAVAALKVHAVNGFFLNWSLTPGQGHGVEMSLVLIALALGVVIEGAGCCSLDNLLSDALAKRSRAQGVKGPAEPAPTTKT